MIDGITEDTFYLERFNEPVLRLGIGLNLFLPRPFRDNREAVLASWHRILAWRGRETFTWTRLGGGNKSRKVNAATYRTIDDWLSGKHSYGKTCWISIHDGPWEAIGKTGFLLEGAEEANETDTTVNYVDLRIPLEALEVDGPDALADRLINVAEPLPFLCGTAGLMLHASPFSRERLWPEMKALVTRFEGVEPAAAEDFMWSAGLGLTSVSWLTFIGSYYVEQLGGANALSGMLASCRDVTVAQLPHGIAIRAGHRPHLGDRNRPSADLDPCRCVYKAVRGAQWLDSDYPFDRELFDSDETLAWLQRFSRAD